MLSRNLEQCLHKALGFAAERRHEFATLEHLLLALSEDQDGLSVLRACGVNVEKLRIDLSEFLEKEFDVEFQPHEVEEEFLDTIDLMTASVKSKLK